SDKDWESIQAGMEKQIFDLTNIIRKRHNLEPVKYDEVVSEVAYLHSKDMYENQYFSHESKDGEGLKERLEAKERFYAGALENIAAQHVDAIGSVQDWHSISGRSEAVDGADDNCSGDCDFGL